MLRVHDPCISLQSRTPAPVTARAIVILHDIQKLRVIDRNRRAWHRPGEPCCSMKKDTSRAGFPQGHRGLNAFVIWTAKAPMPRLPGLLLLAAASLSAQTVPPPDPIVQKIVGEISPDRIAASIKKLAGFETRGNYSNPSQKTRGIGAARLWIFAQLQGYSQQLRVTYDVGRKRGTDVASVVAILPGSAQPEKRIIVSAHYDSVNLRATGDKAAEAPAPGARRLTES